MEKFLFAGRAAQFVSSFAVLALVLVGIAGCSWFGEEEQAQEAASPAASVVIEPIDGMKYYVGGPRMAEDKYGRMRISGLSGEVKKPTSRGLVIGFKDHEDDRFEFRTWLNGAPVTKQFGFKDEAGLLWWDERSTLNSDGVVVVRQVITYDEDKELIFSTVDYYDPADGEIVKTYNTEHPYNPDDTGDGEEEEDSDWGEEAPDIPEKVEDIEEGGGDTDDKE
jgi:hypothetical protein